MRYIVIGLISYLVCLLWLIPTNYLVSWFVPNDSEISIINPQGTVHEGKAAQISVSGQTFTNVRWQLAPWSLLLGRIEVAVRSDDGSKAKASINLLGQIQIKEALLKRPASAINPYLPRGANTTLFGSFLLQLKQATWASDKLTAIDGRLVWKDSALKSMMGDTDFGELVLTAKGDDEQGIRGKLIDTKQRLGLNASFDWQASGKFELKGTTLPEADIKEKNISNLLKLFAKAKPDEQGKLSFTYAATLPWPQVMPQDAVKEAVDTTQKATTPAQ